jgi:hypothetical protein
MDGKHLNKNFKIGQNHKILNLINLMEQLNLKLYLNAILPMIIRVNEI